MRFEKRNARPSGNEQLALPYCWRVLSRKYFGVVATRVAALEDCVGTQDSFDVDIELYYFNSSSQSSFLISLNSLMTKQMKGQYCY